MDSGDKPDEVLTARELDVLKLVLEGLSNAEIATRLGVSARTVHAHISNSLKKTGTRTRVQLVVHALRTGIVPLHDPEERRD
jgi:DNA-binding CsgD family transcriptional regulator